MRSINGVSRHCVTLSWHAVRVAALLCVSASMAQADVFAARVSKVVDGDTLWVKPESGEAPRKLRLQGIDAPEICQSGGVASRDALRQLVTAACQDFDQARFDASKSHQVHCAVVQ